MATGENSDSKQKKEKRERRGPSCLGIGLGVGCVAPAAFCIGVTIIAVIIFALVQEGEKAATDEAIEANDGRGSLEEPITAGEWMKFDDGQVRATRMIRPADDMVEDFNMFNDESAEGAEFALVWYEVKCEKESCTAFNINFHLVDVDGKQWDEESFMVLDEDLDGQEAIEGGMMSGWQVFEIAQDKAVQALKIKFGAATLYVEPPANEVGS